MAARGGARALSQAEGTAHAQGARALGRRAADARHRPRASHRPGAPASRRALAGPRAARGERGDGHHPRPQGRAREHAARRAEREMALQLADRVYVIDHGTVVFEGTPAALRAERQVTATYLGVSGYGKNSGKL